MLWLIITSALASIYITTLLGIVVPTLIDRAETIGLEYKFVISVIAIWLFIPVLLPFLVAFGLYLKFSSINQKD